MRWKPKGMPTTCPWLEIPMTEERAILAGGCFWGVQELVRHLEGVLSTRA